MVSIGVLVVGMTLALVKNWADPDMGPCPRSSRNVSPLDVQLTAGIEEHQSWIDFPAPQGSAPRVVFALCVDGRLVEVGVRGSIEDLYRINVRTRWVDWQWMRGRLGGFQDPNRWSLALFLCEPAPNGSLSCE